MIDKPWPMAKIFYRVGGNPFDETTGKGIINAGVAQNWMLHDLLAPKLAALGSLDETTLHYQMPNGMENLRKGLAGLIARCVKNPSYVVNPDHVSIAGGASPVIDHLIFALANPGDVVITPSPYYGAFDMDVCLRANAELVAAPLSPPHFKLELPLLTHAYDTAKAAGKRVAVLLLVNPNNPFGEVYSPQLMGEIMRWCEERQVHLVADELYMHSVFDEHTHFESALSINATHHHMSAERLHIIYGLSKDFGMSGYRIGCCYTDNKNARQVVESLYFSQASAPIQQALGLALLDKQWTDHFIATNRQRLRANYKTVSDRLKKLGLPFLPSHGGFFIWFDMRRALPPAEGFATPLDRELAFADRFLDAGVYVTPGMVFHAAEPGWGRLCFALKPHVLTMALDAIEKVISKPA